MATSHGAEKSRMFSKDNVGVTALIFHDGNHAVLISGSVRFPMYYPGDAYDSEGNARAIPRVHGLFVVKELMDQAYAWIAKEAPQPRIGSLDN